MTFDVLCLRPKEDFERVQAIPPTSLRVTYRSPHDGDVPVLMKQVRALMIPAVGPKLPANLFESTTVEFVQVTGAGLDRLDLPELKKLGIRVANVPGGSNSAVAEYVITAVSLLLRRLAWADAEIRAGNYQSFRARMLAENLSGLDGLLVGLVGLGTIGMAVAQAFDRLGCRICYFDPARQDFAPAREIDARSVALNELLAACDVVSLHVPLLPGTRGLIGSAELAIMKPDAVLIQTSRGGIVDESALAACLKSGHLGGAAIDVYSSEPPAPDNPLLCLDGDAARRTLLTPHIAGVTRQSATFLFRSAWQNLERVLVTKEPAKNCIE